MKNSMVKKLIDVTRSKKWGRGLILYVRLERSLRWWRVGVCLVFWWSHDRNKVGTSPDPGCGDLREAGPRVLLLEGLPRIRGTEISREWGAGRRKQSNFCSVICCFQRNWYCANTGWVGRNKAFKSRVKTMSLSVSTSTYYHRWLTLLCMLGVIRVHACMFNQNVNSKYWNLEDAVFPQWF